MSEPPLRSPGGLAERLLAAARDEAPPESSTRRALELVESDALDTSPEGPLAEASVVDGAPVEADAVGERATGRHAVRWWPWALAAAAVVSGVVALAALRPAGGDGITGAPAATATDPALAAAASASAVVDAPPSSTASGGASAVASAGAVASASASAAASVPPSAVAQQDEPNHPATGPKAKPKAAKPPAATGACGCAPADLMCMMRCRKR